MPAVDALRLLHIFRMNLAALVIDDDEMQTSGLEKTRELIDLGKPRTVFCLRDDVMGQARA